MGFLCGRLLHTQTLTHAHALWGTSLQESYLHNEAYAEFLAGWDANFYAKYTDYLKPSKPKGRVLDVGCGVGQVVGRLTEARYEAYGVDVSEPNIERARRRCPLPDV